MASEHFAKLLHKAWMIIEDESQQAYSHTVRGFKALPLLFKYTITFFAEQKYKNLDVRKRKIRGQKIQDVFLLLWNNVEEVLTDTGLCGGQVNEWFFQEGVAFIWPLCPFLLRYPLRC